MQITRLKISESLVHHWAQLQSQAENDRLLNVPELFIATVNHDCSVHINIQSLRPDSLEINPYTIYI